MRISSLAASLLLFVCSFSASAEDSPRKELSLGTSFGYQGLALRKLIDENNLVFFGVGYGKTMSDSRNTYSSTTASSALNSNNYYVTTGVRHYLSNDKLSSFIELELTDSRSSGTNNYSGGSSGNISGNSTTAILGYGLEYFLDTHLSVEARAGVGYGYSKSESSSGSSSTTRITSKDIYLPTVGISITRYW
jgi:hypothetical protein